MKPIIVIPARLAASRLPNKPLADIGGKPMIVRVVERARLCGIDEVLVAAGDKEIVDVVKEFGADAVLTDPALPSGSDRIKAAIDIFDKERKYDTIINLQGDMPTFEPSLINDALAVLEKYPAADIATLLSPSSDENEKVDENVVKGIISLKDKISGECLYFTRANAPWSGNSGDGGGDIFRHVGLYVYRRAALEKFVSLPPSALEKREKLEQLRALENGLKIYAALVKDFPKGVDTKDHLEMAREYYRKNNAK